MKSANIVQFPRHGLTASIPIDPSEIALNTRQGIKTSPQNSRVENDVALAYWACLVVGGTVMAFA